MGKKFWIYSLFIISSAQGQFINLSSIYSGFSPRKYKPITIVKLKPVSHMIMSTTLPNLNMFGSIFIELFKKQVQNIWVLSLIVHIRILSHETGPVSEVFRDPLNSSPECTFLTRLHFRVTHITTHSKSMFAPFKVLPLIPWGKLSISENLIGFSRCFRWELLINGTGVD